MALSQSVPDRHTSQASQQERLSVDLEKGASDEHLKNTTVNNFAWQNITVTVKDHKTKQPKELLRSVRGVVQAGKIWWFVIK